jgi:acyl-[acyl-carrier-protein]-phospholipid O-acyltransferase/long-chain-fatty-acid--[acyl-carrier-protein] ligase
VLSKIIRQLGRVIFGIVHRVEVRGWENYRLAGDRVLIIANHASLLDGALLYLYLPEAPLFAIDPVTTARRALRPFLRLAEVVPLDHTEPSALEAIAAHVRAGRKVVIFPEGRITTTGALMKLYESAGIIAALADAAILPIGIEGAQYSLFSHLSGIVRRRLMPKIRITILPPQRLSFDDRSDAVTRRKTAALRIEEIMGRIAYANLYRETTLFDAVIEAMRLHGAGRVVVADDLQRGALTYRQLLVRAFALGEAITGQTRGGEHVGVMLPNSTSVLTVFLALHSHGRVPAMLNFTAGSQALLHSVQTASIRVIYTARRFIDQTGLGELVRSLEQEVQIVYLEDLAGRISTLSRLRALLAGYCPRLAYRSRHTDRSPEATAAILFTSGSEGAPKGVVLSHANLLANVAQTRVLISLFQRDLVFNALPVFHSFGLTAGTFLPLLSGAGTYFYPTPLHYKLIPELCYRLGATVLFGTNTFLAAYAQAAHPYDFHALRYVIAGAEKLQAETRRVWAERFGLRILEGYGATEASPVVSVNTPLANKPGTVGRLLTGIDYYLEPVEGIATGGSLVIRGPNVMRGYLYRGSDGEIVPPVSGRGAGWYDTGDIVEMDDDGFLRIVGRAKRFAKVGGEMVSLGAVEEIAMARWPGVLHAAVAVPDPRKGEVIVLVTQQADADRRQFLDAVQRSGASELHVPRRIIVVDEMPVLGTGKLDYPRISEIARQAGAG